LAPLKEILDKAQAHLAEGYFENAIEVFSEYLLIEPNEPEAYQGRALANFQVKNWNAAISDFKRAAELNPEEPENWVGLGMSLAMVNQIYEAIDAFEALIAKHPGYVRGHIQLGSLYYRLGIIKKGHEQMDLALASRPSLAERRMIEGFKKEQRVLDKRRFYKPDFEELRRRNKTSKGFLRVFFDFMKNRCGKKRS